MAMNKYMHPRNIYKNPPNFKKLADCYPEFTSISRKDVTGKVTIDFKDPHVLRVLTACLLKSDFNLEVSIPEDRLVPTLPLRLNYILWIEDLLNTINSHETVRGIDIGTGACAIYPLLAARKNKWHMLGTETDDASLKIAKENVVRNNFQDYITLRKNTTKFTMEYLFMDDNKQYDFCMCNPPFYVNIQEVWESRSPARPPPKNAFTGSPQELITEGGELQFCRQMLEESKKLKDNILIFTTMIGHKYNLKELLLDIKAEGIKHTTTEFCQGRVTRWGLAWTYQNYDFSKLGYDLAIRSSCTGAAASYWKYLPAYVIVIYDTDLALSYEKTRKKKAPVTFIVPKKLNQPYDMEGISNKLKSLLNDLSISYKLITKRKNELILDIIAYTNTWSNQRRKRRLLKFFENQDCKKAKHDDFKKPEYYTNEVIKNIGESNENNKSVNFTECSGHIVADNSNLLESQKELPLSANDKNGDFTRFLTKGSVQQNNNTPDTSDTQKQDKLVYDKDTDCTKNSQEIIENSNKLTNNTVSQKGDTFVNDNNKNAIETQRDLNRDPLSHAIIKIIVKEDSCTISMEYLSGTAGKEGLHQILQFIKNSWN